MKVMKLSPRKSAEHQWNLIEDVVLGLDRESLLVNTRFGAQIWAIIDQSQYMVNFVEDQFQRRDRPEEATMVRFEEYRFRYNRERDRNGVAVAPEKMPPHLKPVGGFLLLFSNDFLEMREDVIKDDYSVWLYDVQDRTAILLAENRSYNCLNKAMLSCDGSFALVLTEKHWETGARSLMVFTTRPRDGQGHSPVSRLPDMSDAQRQKALRYITTDHERELAVWADVRGARFGNQSGNLLVVASTNVVSVNELPDLHATRQFDCGVGIVDFWVSQQDKRIAVADEGGNLSVWDLHTGRRLVSVEGFLSIVNAVLEGDKGHTLVYTD